MNVLCRLRAHQTAAPTTSRMVDRYLTHDVSDRENAAFRGRLGFCVMDLIAADAPDRQRLTDTLVRQALETKDVYAARDILAHPSCGARADEEAKRAPRTIVRTAALTRPRSRKKVVTLVLPSQRREMVRLVAAAGITGTAPSPAYP